MKSDHVLLVLLLCHTFFGTHFTFLAFDWPTYLIGSFFNDNHVIFRTVKRNCRARAKKRKCTPRKTPIHTHRDVLSRHWNKKSSCFWQKSFQPLFLETSKMKVTRSMAPPKKVPPKRKGDKVGPPRMAKKTPANSLDFQYKVYRKLGPLFPVYR